MDKPIFKIRCSALSQIMSNPKGGSPMQKYLDAKAEVELQITKYNAMETRLQGMASGLKLKDKITKLTGELIPLEKNKDTVQLSDTCIKHLEQWVKENYYGRKKQLKTNAIDKGVEKEFEAVYLLNKALGTKYKKDNEHLENDYMTGHLDIDDAVNKIVIDTKVCESFDTFPVLETDVDLAYWWQLQGYMAFKGYSLGKIAKILVNSPEWQIKAKIKNSFYRLSEKYEDYPQIFQEEHEAEVRQIMLNHVFDQAISIDGKTIDVSEVIPLNKRYKLFEVTRDDEAIARIEPRVMQCREYLKQNGY